ncbi:MAG TPA: SDR family oxidoreductase [Chloroflexaceae bacterium]|nr:SDR family oxidoreductase [Chloroflexaceae bacterium]
MATHPILVTGATGNAGAALTRVLAAAGHRVRAADLRPASLPPGVAFAPFDFNDPATFGPALREVRRVFLLRPPQLADVKRQFDPFLQAMARAGVEQVTFLSLIGAQHNRLVPHRAIEDRLIASGLGWTMLRCGFFMQNLSGAHRAEIRELGEIIVPAGRGRTSFIDVRDIAAVAARTLTEDGHAGRAYPLTGAVALDYFEVASVLSQVLGRAIVYRRPSLLRFARFQLARGAAPAFVAVMAGIYTTTRLGMAATVTPDAARLLGRPQRTLRAFAEDHAAVWS